MTDVERLEYKAGLSVEDVKDLTGGNPVTRLSSNENPFGPSPKAIAAAQAALETANVYPARDDAALCSALSGFHGRGLTSSHFFAANSGVEALSLIEDACGVADNRAIISPPCFGAYAASLKKKNAGIDIVTLKGESFAVDVDGILAAVTPETRLVYLCNPNNPTGTWFGEDVLSGILARLPDHVTLIYDEVYFQFATEKGLPDAIRHVLDGRNIVIVHSFSKAYGLAGLRVGYGIAAPALTKRIQQLKRPFHINAVAMSAAMAALQDDDHLNTTVRNNHDERSVLIKGLQALGLKPTVSQANFVMFECPDGMDADSLTRALVEQAVMVRPAFHLPRHIRATIGTPDDNARLLDALSGTLGGQK
ncbi:MAG: histidinol-phosphate transaminase [Ruegeria sp.]